MCLWDAWHDLSHSLSGTTPAETKDKEYSPSVCVILAGLNEADTIVSTLESVWGSYPRLEIVVVDDGLSNGMSELAHEFAAVLAAGATILLVSQSRIGGGNRGGLFCVALTTTISYRCTSDA